MPFDFLNPDSDSYRTYCAVKKNNQKSKIKLFNKKSHLKFISKLIKWRSVLSFKFIYFLIVENFIPSTGKINYVNEIDLSKNIPL